MVDVNPRALACAEWGLKRNGVSQFETCLNAYVGVEPIGSYDLVLANPPYYSNQKIARIMFEGGFEALRPAGMMLLVTKQPEWYHEQYGDKVAEYQSWSWRDYTVIAVRQFDD